jgi:hypothetical protein
MTAMTIATAASCLRDWGAATRRAFEQYDAVVCPST